MPASKEPDGKRELLVSRTWLQVAGLVFLAGFFVLVLLAYRTYQSDPPIPERAVDPAGGPCTQATTSARARRSS